MKIHLAGPLFTEAERDWIRKLKNDLESLAASQGKPITVIWPYELLTQSEIQSLGKQAKHEIFSRCKAHLDDTDLRIALIDGARLDDRAAWKIGYFGAKRSGGKKIIGLRSVFRRAGESEGAVNRNYGKPDLTVYLRVTDPCRVNWSLTTALERGFLGTSN